MVPVGYEVMPLVADECIKPREFRTPNNNVNWLIIGDVSGAQPTFHVKKWKDIVTDIDLKLPKYLDIRRMWKGV